MAELKLRGVRKSYGSVEVIKGIDLDADSDDLPDGIPIKSRTVFRELTGRDSD